MLQIHSLIDRYNELSLTDNLGVDSWSVLAPGLHERKLVFGGRPLCSVLRPLFHTPRGWSYLSDRTALVLNVFRKVSEAMMATPELRAQVYLTPEEEELIQLPTGYATNIPNARLDSFYCRHDDGRVNLSFIEFNAESPAGIGYGDVMAQLFTELPLMQRFAQEYNLRPILAQKGLLDALLDIYHQWCGNHGQLPKFAIVDWDNVPTTSEFEILASYFGQHGVTGVICNPDELDYRGGKLYACGEAVDFVYKRVLGTELVGRYGLDHPIVHALRDGAICMANPFNCKLLHKKASFAVVSDERNAHLFNAAELNAIHQHIPWTRVVEERFTLDKEGHSIDLVLWASRNKDHLVIKPNDDYGGAGVIIGWETSESEWEQALLGALEQPSIVQERVEIAYEYFPFVDATGSTYVGRRLVDCDPFIYGGDHVGGCLVRLSSVTLLNVTAGGGSVVPAFVVEER